MSNVSLLLGSESAEPPTDYEPSTAWLAGNYSVPIFWLSMFGTEDLTSWSCTLDPDDTYTTVVGRREHCIERSSERLAQWADRWPVLAAPAALWLEFLRVQADPIVAIWTEDISDMSGDEEFAADLRRWLGGLDDVGSTGLRAALAQSYLQVDPDDAAVLRVADGASIGLVVAGAAWAAAAPWSDG